MIENFAILASVVVMALCAAALYGKDYKDNWPQHAGLWVIAVSCAAYAVHFWRTDDVAVREMLCLIGVALYGVGTAMKVWKYRGT